VKHRHITALIVVAASVSVVSVVLARQAQDRFTLKAANGIAFSEFRGYDAWQMIATSQPEDAGGCGTSKVGCTKAILGNPTMIKAYSEGIPANGKPVPDGAVMAKIEWLIATNAKSPYDVTVPGEQTEVSFMVKDSKRFPETNGWGYATFQYDAPSDTYKLATDDPNIGKTLCHVCHTRGAKAARDFVYTDYARR
jgi:hypothetical protein